MRKIEEAMCAAVKEHRNWKNGNTEVKVYKIGDFMHTRVYLHGNIIWMWNEAEDIAEFTLAGCNTNTTRSRLNALGVGVTQRNWLPYYNGHEICSDAWYVVK